MMDNIRVLDQFDRKIISLVVRDGRISVTQLAKQIGMSKSPCQVRLKKLQEDGFIVSFRAVLNPKLFGVEHVAFVEVKLSDTRESALSAFNKAVFDIPEIEQCHMIAGAFDYLLKVRTDDIHSYRKVLGEQITTLPNVANTSTFVAMESVKDYAY